ncbi:MAG: redoxin domain-containing protein [Myxococcales bacterium]|nr:redoxin domain-containing protein [Myxococcales bacterium]
MRRPPLISRRDALAGLATSLALPLGCASKGPEPDFADPDLVPRGTSLDGVPYPTDNLGRAARASGVRGSRIENLAFQAFVDSNRAAGLKPVELADYFDPERKRHRVLHITAVATWCSVCSSESDDTVRVKDMLTKEGAAIMQIVVNGNSVTFGPSLGEVEGWIERHDANYTLAIDVRARRVSSSLGIVNVPWNLLVDVRTMEILHSQAGAPSDVAAYVREGLRFVNENPPSY